MKTLILTILLIGGLAYPQSFLVKDSVVAHAREIEHHAQEILDLEGTTVDVEAMQQQINALTDLVSGIDSRVNSLEDSIVVYRNLFDQIMAGGVVEVPSPLPITNLLATPVSTTQVNLSWTASTSVYDSIYIYRDGSLIVRLDSGEVSYSNTGLSASTVYEYDSRTVKYANGLALLSNYSNSDTAKTFDEAPPAPSAGIDYFVSLWGGGDTLTLSEALNLNVTGKVFKLDKGVYNLSNSINFSKSYNTWIGTLHPDDEKNRDADGTKSTVLTVTAGSQSTVTLSGAGIDLRQMVIEQTEARYLFYVTNRDCEIDSVAFKYTIETNSGTNHLIQVSSGGDATLFTHCWVYDAPRCAFWFRGTTDAPDSCIIEYTWIKDCDGHNAIQYMPSTETYYTSGQSSPAALIKGAVIRYCTFEDNPYSDVIVFRNCESPKVYGNLFIRSGKTSMTDQYPNAPYYFDTSSVGYYCYNTVIGEASSDIGVFGNQNSNGLVVKNNVMYNASNWYNGLILRNEVMNTGLAGQDRIDLRHDYDYNQYYQGSDPTGASMFYVLWSDGESLTGRSYSWATWRSTRGQDLHSTVNTIPSFVDYAGGDYNVTTSNMSGNTDNIPADVRAYTMDGEVRDANSIGMNNKK